MKNSKLKTCLEMIKNTTDYSLNHIELVVNNDDTFVIYSFDNKSKMRKNTFFHPELSVIPRSINLGCYIGIDSQGFLFMEIY